MDEDSRLEANLQHAKDSYSNAQDIIKFIDSKSAILTGILVITTAVPFAVLQIPITNEHLTFTVILTWFADSSIVGQGGMCLSVLLLIAGIGFGCSSLLSSTNGLRARCPRKTGMRERGLFLELLCFLLGRDKCNKKTTPKPTALFPQYSPAQSNEAKKVFEKLRRGQFSKQEILNEYAIQLESVGNVLEAKICANKSAFRWFEIQIISYAGSAIIAGLLAAWSLLPIHTKLPTSLPSRAATQAAIPPLPTPKTPQ